MKPQQPQSPRDPALEAAKLLVEAYRRGRSEGGHVDWSDVDLAHECARRALFQARQRCRRERGPTPAANASDQGRKPIPTSVLDLLDQRLIRIRELATSLVADGDESQEEALEGACELAQLVLDLDSDARAGALPRAWQPAPFVPVDVARIKLPPSLGKLILSARIPALLTNDDLSRALQRHAYGDWGECSPVEWNANNEAVVEGRGELLSAYYSSRGVKFLVITDTDRLVTSVLLPEEY